MMSKCLIIRSENLISIGWDSYMIFIYGLIGRFRFLRWSRFWTRDITNFCVIWRHAFKLKSRRWIQTWKPSFWGWPLTCAHMTSHSDVRIQVNVYLNLLNSQGRASLTSSVLTGVEIFSFTIFFITGGCCVMLVLRSSACIVGNRLPWYLLVLYGVRLKFCKQTW